MSKIPTCPKCKKEFPEHRFEICYHCIDCAYENDFIKCKHCDKKYHRVYQDSRMMEMKPHELDTVARKLWETNYFCYDCTLKCANNIIETFIKTS